MSQTVKKQNQGQAPESYSPKKPEILSMAEDYAQGNGSTALPERYVITPKEKIADFNGEKWPFSNVLSAMLPAVGLLYGRTERRNDTGVLINDDVDYSIQNVLNGEAFGIFYSPDAAWTHSLGMEIYGLNCERLKNPEYTASEMVKLVCRHISGGNAVIIRKEAAARAYVAFGYEDNGGALLCCEFEDGNDDRNCSYNFSKPVVIQEWSNGITDLLLIKQNDQKISRDEAYKKALANGWRLITLQSPDNDMNIGLLRGAGQPLYDEWIRQLEQDNAKCSEAYYFAAPVFPHFFALYENRLHLMKFLKICAEMYGDERLFKAASLSEQLKNLAQEAAQIGYENKYSDEKILAMTNNERRNLLIDLLKKCRSLEVEIAGHLKMFIDAPEKL